MNRKVPEERVRELARDIKSNQQTDTKIHLEQECTTCHQKAVFWEHITKIFDKYVANNVRVLNKQHAVDMLKAEFGLEDQEAEVMFNTFDKDKNGKLSIWEFQQFCVCMGEHAQEIVTKFKELDKDGSGQLDPDEARAGLRAIRTATGRELAEKEVEFFVQTTCGENGVLDLGQFTNLLYRLKLYNAPPPK